MKYLLLGGGGVLGSGFGTVLARQQAHVVRLRPPWSTPSALRAHLLAQVSAHLSELGPTTVVWAAGVGHVGAPPAALAAETAGVMSICDSIRGLPSHRRSDVSVLFASSAGALFGGHGGDEVSAQATPCPITAYGREKLAQEELLRELAQDAGCRVLACRISNLYGLAGGRLTSRGLIATAVRSTRLRQPMTVYVSPDTRRDYVFSADAAAVSLHALGAAPAGFTSELVRDGCTRTVSEVLSLVGRVCRRRVPATYAERPETRLQPHVLRFSRPPQGADEVRRTPMEAAVHAMLRAPMTA